MKDTKKTQNSPKNILQQIKKFHLTNVYVQQHDVLAKLKL